MKVTFLGHAGLKVETKYATVLVEPWLSPLLNGEVPWEDSFLSLRFVAWRNPDIYNDHLLGLLKFACPQSLKAVEEYETSMDSKEQITIHTEEQTY